MEAVHSEIDQSQIAQLAQAAAFDASVYDQQGCLSPHVFYVEERGPLSPRKFAADRPFVPRCAPPTTSLFEAKLSAPLPLVLR